MDKEFAQKVYDMFCEDELTIVEEGEWVEDYKYSHRDTVVEFEGKTYQISESRSGSYHTDYYYNDPSVAEVTKREVPKIVVEWHVVGESVECASGD